jgi:hypothetical protein
MWKNTMKAQCSLARLEDAQLKQTRKRVRLIHCDRDRLYLLFQRLLHRK